MADDREERKKPKLKLVKGEGTRTDNKIICFNCRNKIRWYPCPRCHKRGPA